MNEEWSLIPQTHRGIEVDKSIESISKPLSGFLSYCNLPFTDVLSPIEERRKVIMALNSILEIIPLQDREKAYYLSKFVVAVTVGLFDGALNFLWDETIKAIRKIIISFDVMYFFSVAKSRSTRYSGLSKEEDLEAIADHDLLEISRRIGIISDIIHKRLETVNYFRNHASAAHPNENELTGIELLSYLEHCIKYAICGKYDHSVIQIKILFENIRRNSIPISDFPVIAEDLLKQPKERIDDFAFSIFGLYTDPKQEIIVRENIKGIIPEIWPAISEDIKYKIGAKHGYYRKNGDTNRKDLVDQFLGIVNGYSYKDEDSLAAELLDKLQQLKAAHFGYNNFYNEYPYAVSIQTSLTKRGIPNAAKRDFVKMISMCYCGNGLGYRQGVDERALPYYEKFISLYGDKEIEIFIELFEDQEFIINLDKKIPAIRVKNLAKLLKDKVQRFFLKQALDVIINSSKIDKVGLTTEYENAIKNIK